MSSGKEKINVIVVGALGRMGRGIAQDLMSDEKTTLVGAVLGVGLARGIGAINLRVVGKIFVSWASVCSAAVW